MKKSIVGLMAGLLLAVTMTSVAQTTATSQAQTSASGQAQSAAPSQTQSAAPTDAQIAAIVVAANKVDIDAGKLAQSKTSSKEVKEFAKLMVADHTNSNQQATALVKKLKVTPQENTTSKSLKQGGMAMEKKLKGLKGAEFDKTYVDNEVAFHQTVLDTIDNTLMPNAKNEELKELLAKTRPAIENHLKHAKSMQASLQGATQGSTR
jgi:putative membrane protein